MRCRQQLLGLATVFATLCGLTFSGRILWTRQRAVAIRPFVHASLTPGSTSSATPPPAATDVFVNPHADVRAHNMLTSSTGAASTPIAHWEARHGVMGNPSTPVPHPPPPPPLPTPPPSPPCPPPEVAPLPSPSTAKAVDAVAMEARDAAATGSATDSSVVLHKSARAWLAQCASAAGRTLNASLPSSEYWRERRFFLFYRHLYCIVHRYAAEADSVLDVGSAIPPFVNALGWISHRTILGPRFAGNVAKGGADMFSVARIESKFNVSAVLADFLEWQPASSPAAQPLFDLVLCTEVVEHIARPREFVQKLLNTGRIIVLSVPYRWGSCDHGKSKCHHLQNHITRSRIASWADRLPHAYDIVEEPQSGERRIICVYHTD